LALLKGFPVDDAHFDALTRSLHSRRTAVSGLLGGFAALLGLGGDANAHNPAPACRRLTEPARRRCLRRARAHHRNRHVCKPRPRAVTCRNRCGGTRNNCRHKVSCACPAGKTCLRNQGCSRACTPPNFDCPASCACLDDAILVETSQRQCVPLGISECAQFPQVCTSTAECPFGQFCGITPCSPGGDDEGRCIPVCPV
jgi:hypothetical protein